MKMQFIMLMMLSFLFISCTAFVSAGVIRRSGDSVTVINDSLWNRSGTTVHLENGTYNVAIGNTTNAYGHELYVEGDSVRFNTSDFIWGNGTENGAGYGYEAQIDFLQYNDILTLHFPTLATNWNNPFNAPSNITFFPGGIYMYDCVGDPLGTALGICPGASIIALNKSGGEVLSIAFTPAQNRIDYNAAENVFNGQVNITNNGNLGIISNNRGVVWQGDEAELLYDGTNDLTLDMPAFDPTNPMVKFSPQGYGGIGINLSAGEHPRGSIDIQRSGRGGFENKVALAIGSHEEDYGCILFYDADFVWSSTSQRLYLCGTAGGGAGNPNHLVIVNETGHIITMIDRDGRISADMGGSSTRPTESVHATRNFSVSNYLHAYSGTLYLGDQTFAGAVGQPVPTVRVWLDSVYDTNSMGMKEVWYNNPNVFTSGISIYSFGLRSGTAIHSGGDWSFVTDSNDYSGTGGTEKMTIDRLGNVGINDIDPEELLTVGGNASIQDNLTVGGNIYLPYYNATTYERGSIVFGEARTTAINAQTNNWLNFIVNNVRVFFCQTGACQFATDLIASSTMTRYLGYINRLWLKIFGYDLFIKNTIGIDIVSPEANLDVNGTTIFRGNITYNDTFWEDLRTPINALRVPTVNPPNWEPFGVGRILAFEDQAVAGNEEIVYFSAQMPHSYKDGTDVEFHLHITGEDNTSCNSNWNVSCHWAAIGESFYLHNFTLEGTCANGAIIGEHEFCDLGDFAPDSRKGLSSMFVCSLRRASSKAADTCNNLDIYLHELDFHYQRDAPGSSIELGK